MAKIALVSVTLNAVNPMTDYFRKKDPDVEIRNYLDSYLLEKVKKEGGINDACMRRMFDMLSTACGRSPFNLYHLFTVCGVFFQPAFQTGRMPG